MKKHSLIATAAILGLLLGSTNVARADFGIASILAQKVINGTITQGSWHVVVSNNGPGNVWDVTAFADSLDVPNTSVEHIQLAFYASSADAKTGANPLAIVDNADLSDGFLDPGAINWTGGAQVGGGATNKQFNSNGSSAQELRANGSNVFHGTILVTDSLKITSVAARLDDTTQSWRGSADLTPEPSSLALLLPGFLPVGLAMRRGRRTSIK